MPIPLEEVAPLLLLRLGLLLLLCAFLCALRRRRAELLLLLFLLLVAHTLLAAPSRIPRGRSARARRGARALANARLRLRGLRVLRHGRLVRLALRPALRVPVDRAAVAVDRPVRLRAVGSPVRLGGLLCAARGLLALGELLVRLREEEEPVRGGVRGGRRALVPVAAVLLLLLLLALLALALALRLVGVGHGERRRVGALVGVGMVLLGVVLGVGGVVGGGEDAGDGGEGVGCDGAGDAGEAGLGVVVHHGEEGGGVGGGGREGDGAADEGREARAGRESGARGEACAEGGGVEGGEGLVVVGVGLGAGEHGRGEGPCAEGVGEGGRGEGPGVGRVGGRGDGGEGREDRFGVGRGGGVVAVYLGEVGGLCLGRGRAGVVAIVVAGVGMGRGRDGLAGGRLLEGADGRVIGRAGEGLLKGVGLEVEGGALGLGGRVPLDAADGVGGVGDVRGRSVGAVGGGRGGGGRRRLDLGGHGRCGDDDDRLGAGTGCEGARVRRRWEAWNELEGDR